MRRFMGFSNYNIDFTLNKTSASKNDTVDESAVKPRLIEKIGTYLEKNKTLLAGTNIPTLLQKLDRHMHIETKSGFVGGKIKDSEKDDSLHILELQAKISFDDPMMIRDTMLTRNEFDSIIEEVGAELSVPEKSKILFNDANKLFQANERDYYNRLKDMWALFPKSDGKLFSQDNVKTPKDLPVWGSLNAISLGKVKLPVYVSNLSDMSLLPDGMECVNVVDSGRFLKKSTLSVYSERMREQPQFPTLELTGDTAFSDTKGCFNKFKRAIRAYKDHPHFAEALKYALDNAANTSDNTKKAFSHWFAASLLYGMNPIDGDVIRIIENTNGLEDIKDLLKKDKMELITLGRQALNSQNETPKQKNTSLSPKL